MNEVELSVSEHPSEPEDPARIPRRTGLEAHDGATALFGQRRSERRFVGQDVRDSRFHEAWIAVAGALDEELLGASGAEPLDQP